MSNLDHILLYCTMLLLARIYDMQARGKVNNTYSVRRKHAPFTAIFLGAIFVITEGCRYGRGVDQLGNYGPFYQHCMNPNSWFQEFETLFVWLNQAVYKIDPYQDIWPFGSIFIVYALIFFVCLFIYYKDKRQDTKGFLALAILATNYITEWTIRQGVSFSFILLGLHFLEKKKWVWMAFFMAIAFGIHHGNVLAIALPVIFYFYLNKKPLPWKITVPLFVVLEYTMQVSFFQNIMTMVSTYLDVSALGGNMAGYLQDSAMAHEAEVSEDWARGTFTQLITVVFYASLIFVGAQNCKIKNKNTYIYNAFVIGIMIYEPFRLAGSLTRLFNVLSCLWFIPLSYALYNYRLLKNSSKLTKWAMIPIFLYIVSYFGRYIFLNPDANYIWNL